MTLTYIAIGLGAGLVSGLFGIGGGIVIVPALVFFARMPIAQATGTSLGVFLLPVGILGAWEYWRNGNLEVRASLSVALGLFLSAWVGARLAQLASPVVMKRGFALLLLFVAVRMWLSAEKKEPVRAPDTVEAPRPGV